jgi:hypothetical protein
MPGAPIARNSAGSQAYPIDTHLRITVAQVADSQEQLTACSLQLKLERLARSELAVSNRERSY